MSPRAKTLLLIFLGALAVLMILAALSSEDDDQNALWRGLSSVLRLLSLIGRLF